MSELRESSSEYEWLNAKIDEKLNAKAKAEPGQQILRVLFQRKVAFLCAGFLMIASACLIVLFVLEGRRGSDSDTIVDSPAGVSLACNLVRSAAWFHWSSPATTLVAKHPSGTHLR